MQRLRIFTWHIHGSYLYYLSQGNYDLFIPVNAQKSAGYHGKGELFPFGDNVIEVAAADVRNMEFDVVLFQSDENYLNDQYDILSEDQRQLPRVYLEHDPPWEHPANSVHSLNDPDVLLVHVTHYNQLMWDNGRQQVAVIEHGVTLPSTGYQGRLNKGIVVINNLPGRGRLLGLDIFTEVRKHIPLDLVGLNNGELGLGGMKHTELLNFISHYRFFFNPIRYTSLGFAVCEAMMQGMPVVGLATTEMATTIKDGYSGFVNTSTGLLIENMQYLLDNPDIAVSMGKNAQTYAQGKFNMVRFTQEWEACFRQAILKRYDYV